jgi:hypothetical protein
LIRDFRRSCVGADVYARAWSRVVASWPGLRIALDCKRARVVGRNSDQWKKVKQPIQNGVPKSLTKPEFCRRKHLAKPSLFVTDVMMKDLRLNFSVLSIKI